MLFRLLSAIGVVAHFGDWLLIDRRNMARIQPKSKRGTGFARLAGALAIAVGLSVVTILAVTNAAEGAANQTTTPYTVTQLVADPNVGARVYATVSGTVHSWYAQHTTNNKNDYELYLIGDPNTDSWMIVQTWKSPDDFEALIGPDDSVTLTGMLRTNNGEVKSALDALGSDVPSVNISKAILLKEGQTPANSLLMLGIAVASGTVAALMLIGWAIGYLVFRPMKSRPGLSTSGMAGPIPVRVTGIIPGFKGGERALEKRVELRVPEQDPANPSATPPLAIVWTSGSGLTGLPLVPGTSQAVMGTAYPMRGARPAIRLRYEKLKLIMSFDTEEARNQAFDQLRSAAGLISSPEGAVATAG